MQKNLLILPFDHRSSFSKKILGIQGTPNEEQTQKIKNLKNLVYKAFLRVRDADKTPEELGILVDEQYGKEIVLDANKKGITTATGVEKSGQQVLQFEYGENFGDHVERLQPDYVKVLIRYHPEDKKGNEQQKSRLRELSAYCDESANKLLLELLVPTEKQEDRVEKTAQAIKELQDINVAVWKLEGFDKKGWNKVLAALPEDAQVVVLGRGENAEKVEFWLKTAAEFPQIIGFAVGRTVFMQPLLSYLKGEIDEGTAIKEIGKNYSGFINLWRSQKSKI